MTNSNNEIQVMTWAISRGLSDLPFETQVQRYNEAHPASEASERKSHPVKLMILFTANGKDRTIMVPSYIKPRGRTASALLAQKVLSEVSAKVNGRPDAEVLASIRVSEVSEAKSLTDLLVKAD